MSQRITNRERFYFDDRWAEWLERNPGSHLTLDQYIEMQERPFASITNAEKLQHEAAWHRLLDENPNARMSLSEYVLSQRGDLPIQIQGGALVSVAPGDKGGCGNFHAPIGFGDLAKPPSLLSPNTKLHYHQRQGLYWLLYGNGGKILSDDMGLGKTVQVIASILTVKESKVPGAYLIAVPKSLLGVWKSEIQTHCRPGSVRCIVLANKQEALQHSFEELQAKYDIVIATKETVWLQIKAFERQQKLSESGQAHEPPAHGWCFLGVKNYHDKPKTWLGCVLDEAHEIRNRTAVTSRYFAQIRAVRKIAVTGTPICNGVADLFSLLRFIGHPVWGQDFRKFSKEVLTPIAKDSNYTKAIEVAASCLLRREKNSMVGGKPIIDIKPKILNKVGLSLSGQERSIYDAFSMIAARYFALFRNSKGSDGNTFDKVLECLLRLRQLCCDPRLLLTQASSTVPANILASIRTLGPSFVPSKLHRVMNLIANILQTDQHAKILVFSEWTQHLEFMDEVLRKQGVKFGMYDGRLDSGERENLLKDFEKPEMKGLFLTLGAGGVGLTLIQANHVILTTPSWNPQREHQAEDRTHRIKQQKQVYIHKIEVADSVETKIMTIQVKKEEFFRRTLRSGAASYIGDEEESAENILHSGINQEDVAFLLQQSNEWVGQHEEPEEWKVWEDPFDAYSDPEE